MMKTTFFLRSLRSGYGGQLRMNPVMRHYGLKDLLPAKTDIPNEGCTHREENGNLFCFDAGMIINFYNCYNNKSKVMDRSIRR